MLKTIYSRQSQLLRERIVNARQNAGFTQRDLAARLGRERSFIARIELGERRVDLAEFYWICKACGVSAETTAADLMRKFARLDKAVH